MPTAIVIPVFNGLEPLRDCISSLAWARDDQHVRVVVVDSGSTDGTLDYLAVDASWVSVVRVGAGAWWTAAVDEGCRYAFTTLDADRVCLLNHDCRWARDDYRRLSRRLDAHPTDIVCSRVVDLRDGSVIFAGGRQRRDGSLTTSHPEYRTQVSVDGTAVVQWCGGMGTLFSAGTYRRVGGFDPRAFPHYFGDSDFCLRAGCAGIRTRYCPGSVVVNDGASTGVGIPREGADLRDLWRSLSSRRSIWNVRDNLRFYARHRRVLAPLALARVYVEWAGLAGVRFLRGRRA